MLYTGTPRPRVVCCILGQPDNAASSYLWQQQLRTLAHYRTLLMPVFCGLWSYSQTLYNCTMSCPELPVIIQNSYFWHPPFQKRQTCICQMPSTAQLCRHPILPWPLKRKSPLVILHYIDTTKDLILL